MRKKGLKSMCAALAAVVMVSGFWMSGVQESVDRTIPQLVSYVDSGDGSIIIEGEETPLAAKPVVKTKTSTKKSTKKVKLPKKAKKSSKSTSATTKKSSSTKVSGKNQVKTDTTVYTKAVTSLKKNSKIKTIQTTVKTTVKTTTTAIPQTAAATTVKSTASAKTSSNVVKAVVSIRSIAPKAQANVLSAYEKMGFTVNVDSTVSYSGRFDAKTRNITVQKNSDEAIYHELGHFVAFVAGNVDQTSEFQNIFASERSKFTGTRNNDAYIKSSAAEYFAESYQDFIERPSVLKSARPQTYKYIADSVAKVTDARASFLCQLYASMWK